MRARVKLREEGEVRRDEAALAGNDDLSAVHMADKCDVRPESEIAVIVHRLVRKADAEAFVGLQFPRRHGEIVVADADDRQSFQLDFGIVDPVNAEFIHLPFKIFVALAGEPALVVARHVVDGGNLYGALEEPESKLIVGEMAVDDVARNNDNVGLQLRDTIRQSLLVKAVELVMQIGYLNDAAAVELRRDFLTYVFVFADGQMEIHIEARAGNEKRQDNEDRNGDVELLLVDFMPEDYHAEAAADGAAEHGESDQFALGNAVLRVFGRTPLIDAE